MTNNDLGEAKIEKKSLPVSQIAGEGFRRYMFSAFAGNIALPIFSLFVPLLALKLGASVFEIGLVGGASNAVYSFMPFVMGRFSDRKQLGKLFIIASFVLLTIVSVSYILIAQPLYLIIARVFEGIGWAMLWPALTAEISRNLEPAEAKRVFSIYNITWSGAAAIGPLVGSALIFFSSIQYAFLGTVFILMVSASVNIYPLLTRGRAAIEGNFPPPSKTSRAEAKLSAGGQLVSPDKSAISLTFYMASCALSAVASGVLFTFFAPYARSIGLSILVVGGITFVFGLGRFITYVLTVNESVRHLLLRNDRRVRNMIIALSFTTATSLVMLVRDPSGLTYLVAYALAGAGMSIVYGIAQAGMIAEATKGNYGRNAGLFESSIGIGASVGPILAGAISGNSIALPFIVPFLGLVLYLILLPLTTRRPR
jgi:MFS family permease